MGDQRKLEIVRAMCIEPRLLCLDEPAAGLNPKESSELNKLLEFIKNDKKTGILLIEHDMSVVMGNIRSCRSFKLREKNISRFTIRNKK